MEYVICAMLIIIYLLIERVKEAAEKTHYLSVNIQSRIYQLEDVVDDIKDKLDANN